MNIFKKFSRNKKTSASATPAADALVDVRSYGGFTNHLVTYDTHKVIEDDILSSAPAMCGYKSWLLRENPEDWIITAEEIKQPASGICVSCQGIALS